MADQTLYSGRFIAMLRRDGWEFATRPGISGIVGVVAVTDEDKLLLVEQYRQPVSAMTIELPAGLAGDHNDPTEPLTEAARRELLEETGFAAQELTEMLTGVSSAGICDERVTLFEATHLRRENAGGGDDTEAITVHEVPLAEVPDFCRAQRRAGKEIDFKILAGLMLLMHG